MQRISVGENGTEADGASYEPKISAYGLSVAFISNAPNLVSGDTNGKADVFVAFLSGSATPVTNNPPTKPTLTYPPNGSTGMPTTLTFIWNRCTDPDGDTVTYKLYIGTDPSFAGISPIIVASLSGSVKYYAMVSGYPIGVIALLGIVTIGGFSKKRKKIGFLILTAMFVIGLTLTSCGGGGGGGSGTPSDNGGTVSHIVSTLQKSTPYYWKVVADDGNGGVTESDTYSFTTGQ